jgi:hypothetical protein
VCLQADSFTIGRIPIEVTCDSMRLLGPVQDVLCPRLGYADAEVFHLSMRYGSEPSGWKNECLRLFWGGLLRGGIVSEYYTGAEQRVAYVQGRAWGRLDFEQRLLEIVCRPGQEGCVYDGCITPLLCELLAWHGHFVIHAASLAFERQGEKVGVLLAGVSGAGKTTTALALAYAGMTLLSDDMSFLESSGCNGERVGLWGLLLACKVHDNTRRLLPWLQGCPTRPVRVEGETCMDVTQAVGESAGVVADPRLLLLLGPRSKGEHVLMPMDKTQAMMKLTSENIRAYEHRADGSAGNAFRALGRLVAQCDVYHLCVGEPLSTLPERIRGLLGQSA